MDEESDDEASKWSFAQLRKKYEDDSVGTLRPEEWRKKHRTKQFRVVDEL